MFCHSCGKDNPKDAAFCGECGAKLQTGVVGTSHSVIQHARSLVASSPKATGIQVSWIGLGTTVALIVAVFGSLWFHGHDKDTIPPVKSPASVATPSQSQALPTRQSIIDLQNSKFLQSISASNLKQIALGIRDYAQAHNGMLPDADEWMDEVMPYVMDWKVFHEPEMPAVGTGGGSPPPTDSLRWGYAYNRNLSGVRLDQVQSPENTVVVYESALGVKNANDTGVSVSQPGRYTGGNNYAFMDYHVKWLRDGSTPSFSLSGQ